MYGISKKKYILIKKMRTLVLNSKNVVSGTNNSRYLYKFPGPVGFKNNEIALASVSMYYSWYSISSSINNNKFQYVWYGGSTPGTSNGMDTADSDVYPNIASATVELNSLTGTPTSPASDPVSSGTYERITWSITDLGPVQYSLLYSNSTTQKGTGTDSDTLVCGKAGSYVISLRFFSLNTNNESLTYDVFVNGVAQSITGTSTTHNQDINMTGTITLEVDDEVNIQVSNADSTNYLGVIGYNGGGGQEFALNLSETTVVDTYIDLNWDLNNSDYTTFTYSGNAGFSQKGTGADESVLVCVQAGSYNVLCEGEARYGPTTRHYDPSLRTGPGSYGPTHRHGPTSQCACVSTGMGEGVRPGRR